MQPPRSVDALRVLIAEDDSSLRELLSLILTRQGFHVSTANDGAEALAQLREGRPHIVITDFEMPRADGLDVCRGVRHHSDHTHTPVLLFTGSAECLPRVAEALRLPYVTLQRKPTSYRALGDLLRALIAEVEAERDTGRPATT